MSDEDILMKLENQGYYFVTNLKPVKMMGVVSEAMILIPTWKEEVNDPSTTSLMNELAIHLMPIEAKTIYMRLGD